MEGVTALEEYFFFIKLLVIVTSTTNPIKDTIHMDENYLKSISILLEDDAYSSLLSIPDWNKILDFINDCRYNRKNIDEKQFLTYNYMIEQVNERIQQRQLQEKNIRYVGDICNKLKQSLFPKSHKKLQKELEEYSEMIVDYYYLACMDSSFIDEVIINEIVDCFELSKSIINEYILLTLLCDLELKVEDLAYLIQSPLTPIAMTRILNFVEINEKEIQLLNNIIDAANSYIETGKFTIIYKGMTYQITATEQIYDYSLVRENDSYTRLQCYMNHVPYKKPKKLLKR